jgi:uncharacterized protein (DUF924 family)
MKNISDVLEFWFSERVREKWWDKDADFDAEIRAAFEATHKAAMAGKLDGWAETPEGALALIIALDQFPRNIYRDTPAAFAGDAKAREIARLALARQHDSLIPEPEQRCFLYIPFEHSEDLQDQHLAVKLFRERVGLERNNQAAEEHRKVIEAHGRFPHRNKILGRQNTPEEDEYLKDPDAGF